MLLLFRYVFVFEEKEDMVRPAEYLLCGGVAVIDNNFQTGFFRLLFCFVFYCCLDIFLCLRKKKI